MEHHAHHHEMADDPHDKHAGHSTTMFKQKFWLSLALTMPTLVFSETIQGWFGYSWVFRGSEYIPAFSGTILFLYGGLVFLKGALEELRIRRPGMMILISLAITVAFGYSMAVTFGLVGMDFWWELATLITIMLLGHWLEMLSISKAENALDAIKQLLPDTAEKLISGKPHKVKVSDLRVGDKILVRPGANIPVDGEITEGASSVNEAAITGESRSVSKTTGDEVVAGTINQDGSLTVRVTKVGDDTALAGIMRLVSEAQTSKSHVQVLADKAAFLLTIIALVAGVMTFAIWAFAKDTGLALERTVTVLVIACPHALGLAIPLVVSISTTLSARNGLLVRKRLALEAARKLDIVLFDKTGTLTRGEHGVTDIWAAHGYSEEDILHLTASLEQNSEHIVGKGIVRAAYEKGVHLDSVEHFSAIPGLGVRGTLHGHDKFTAAGYRYIVEHNLDIPEEINAHIKQAARAGKSEVYLIDGNDTVIGALALTDQIREESKAAIDSLRRLGIKSAMITGDSETAARYVANELGVDQYFAGVKPEDKAFKVKELQAKGLRVAFVGDGINDAPALTQANIGIAIGGGTDVAIKSADIILIKNNPYDVIKVITLSQATYRKMTQNLIWATGYNVFAIPLAAGVLYNQGIVLAPAIGAVLMSLSTVIVAINAQLLRRLKFTD